MKKRRSTWVNTGTKEYPAYTEGPKRSRRSRTVTFAANRTPPRDWDTMTQRHRQQTGTIPTALNNIRDRAQQRQKDHNHDP